MIFIKEKERTDKIEKVRLLRDVGLSDRDIEAVLVFQIYSPSIYFRR
jgi:hypothetical protein